MFIITIKDVWNRVLFRFSLKKTQIRFGMSLVWFGLKSVVSFGYDSYLLLT